MVKNPNWYGANQLAIQLAVRAGLELGASELEVQCSNHSATLPPLKCRYVMIDMRKVTRRTSGL